MFTNKVRVEPRLRSSIHHDLCHWLYWHLHFSIAHVPLSRCKSKTGCEIPGREDLWFDFGSYGYRFHDLTRSFQNFGWLHMQSGVLGRATRGTTKRFQVPFVQPTNQDYCSGTRQMYQNNQPWTFITSVKGLKVPSVESNLSFWL